mgnify:CR=1 FL=1
MQTEDFKLRHNYMYVPRCRLLQLALRAQCDHTMLYHTSDDICELKWENITWLIRHTKYSKSKSEMSADLWKER